MALPNFRLTLWAIGLMVGAGIYSTIGDIVRESGLYAPLVFLLALGVMVLNGAVLAITVSRFPHAGSILKVVQTTLPSWAAPMFEVLRLVEGGLALCVTNKLTVRFLYGLLLGPGVDPGAGAEICSLLAFACIVWRGLDSAIDAGNLFTFVEVGGLLLVIATGGLLATQSTAKMAQLALPRFDAMTTTLCVKKVIFAYGGVQGVLDMAGDIPSAGTTLPGVVMWAIVITGVLYTLVCCSTLSMVGVEGLTSKNAVSPLGFALEKIGFPFGTEATLTLVSMVSVGNTCLAIFAFVSRIALSLSNYAIGGGVNDLAVHGAMLLCCTVVSQAFNVFALIDKVGIMLLVTFAVLNLAFLMSISRSVLEKVLGLSALLVSATFVLVDLRS